MYRVLIGTAEVACGARGRLSFVCAHAALAYAPVGKNPCRHPRDRRGGTRREKLFGVSPLIAYGALLADHESLSVANLEVSCRGLSEWRRLTAATGQRTQPLRRQRAPRQSR
jgi:hypothetical protein